MAVTIEMAPQMVQEMRGYAVADGMSVEQMCLEYISREMQRRRETGDVLAAAEAHRCDTILTEDLNDGQVYSGVRAVDPFRPRTKTIS